MTTIILQNITVFTDVNGNVTLAKDNITGKFVKLKLANEILNSSLVICDNVDKRAMELSDAIIYSYQIILGFLILCATFILNIIKHCSMRLLSVLYSVFTTTLRVFVSLFKHVYKTSWLDKALIISSIVLITLSFVI